MFCKPVFPLKARARTRKEKESGVIVKLQDCRIAFENEKWSTENFATKPFVFSQFHNLTNVAD